MSSEKSTAEPGVVLEDRTTQTAGKNERAYECTGEPGCGRFMYEIIPKVERLGRENKTGGNNEYCFTGKGKIRVLLVL